MITSVHNKRVAKAVRLKKRAMREKDRRFLVEGVQAVREALQSDATVEGVQPGERVITVGGLGLDDDAKVRVVQAGEGKQ